MSQNPDCIFCRIAAGAIPCFKLYEDGETIAFMDITRSIRAMRWSSTRRITRTSLRCRRRTLPP